MTETGILINQDIAVAAWTWNKFNLTPMFINRAFGLLNNGNLVGSVILHNFNGADVEFSLYPWGFQVHCENCVGYGSDPGHCSRRSE
jgi:hypothetical protein